METAVAEKLPPSAPATITASKDPTTIALWCLARAAAEAFYKSVWERKDTEALRWLGANDRYFLLTNLLKRADARNDFLYARCREVEADPDDHLDLWARDHYKSTIITFAGTIQEIIKDQEITVGILSNTRPVAKPFLRQIKEELESNETLKWLYPDIFWQNPKKQAPKWSEDEGIIVKRKSNPKEATVEAWGIVDGMPVGRHFALLIYDDLVTEKTVTNPDMIKKTTYSFELSENLSRREVRMWMAGTRYHFADTYGVILKRKVISERRHSATDDGTFEGSPIFLTQRQWERKLAGTSRSTIAAQQLLNPLEGSETTFDIRKLRLWRVRPKRLNVYILCDPSKGLYRSTDDCGISIVGIDVNRNKYLLAGYRHKMKLSERWQTLKREHQRWTRMQNIAAVFVGYEQYGMQTDIEHFESEMERENYHFPIEEVSWTRQGEESKRFRIERLEPDFRSGRFHIPEVVHIDDEGNIDTFDAMRTKKCQEAIARGEEYTCAKPLHAIDEMGKRYDLIAKFIEEFAFFPFGSDHFLDSMSRIYDMDPQAPIFYSEEPGAPNSPEPEVFYDT